MPPKEYENLNEQDAMGKKGQKSRKGVGELYNEPKVDTLVSLTPTAKANLDKRAKELNVSRSEIVERFARNLFETVALSEEERAVLGNY